MLLIIFSSPLAGQSPDDAAAMSLSSSEGLERLMELFASQKSMLESLLAEKADRAKAAPAEDYFTLFERGQRQEVLDFVLRARPQEIEECVDIRGFTLLHIAVRALDVDLTHAVLDKCEQLANSATTLLRSPPGFTPLMNPWINFRNCYPI